MERSKQRRPAQMSKYQPVYNRKKGRNERNERKRKERKKGTTTKKKGKKEGNKRTTRKAEELKYEKGRNEIGR